VEILVLPKVKQALQAQGFGTLTEIDVQATLEDKLGGHGALSHPGRLQPRLAHRAWAFTERSGS
jgi:hypothetical protein